MAENIQGSVVAGARACNQILKAEKFIISYKPVQPMIGDMTYKLNYQFKE